MAANFDIVVKTIVKLSAFALPKEDKKHEF